MKTFLEHINENNKYYSEWFSAVKNFDHSKMLELIKNGVDVNMLTKSKIKHTALTTIILTMPSDRDILPAATDKRIPSVLCIHELLEAKADVNKNCYNNEKAYSPLCVAASKIDTDMIEWLIQDGAELNPKNVSETPINIILDGILHFMKNMIGGSSHEDFFEELIENRLSCVKLLFNNGSKFNKKSFDLLTEIAKAVVPEKYIDLYNQKTKEIVKDFVTYLSDKNPNIPASLFIYSKTPEKFGL